MKATGQLTLGLLAVALLGCGSSASNPESETAPRVVQHMTAVSIAGYRDNYTIVKNPATNEVLVISKSDQSVLTYQNPRLIKFVDKWTSFETDGAAGRVYRLYLAAFDRAPDQAELGFWVHAHQTDAMLSDMAKGFVARDEFKADCKVLHPAGDAAGVLLDFSESAEHKASLAPLMQNGFDYVPYNSGAVRGM